MYAGLFDVYDTNARSFQEIVDLNAGSLLVDHSENEVWEQLISETLSTIWPRTRYTQIASRHLVGILLTVYIKVHSIN